MTFEQLLNRSYVPYSERRAACVVAGITGKQYPGVRIENLSYPLSITHIQAAVFQCLAAGDQPAEIILPEEPHHSDLPQYWKNESKAELVINPDLEISAESPVLKLSENQITSKLLSLCDQAVIPNSGFPVSCLLETPEGFVPGVNVEVSSWELGLCAERMAVTAAISHGITEFTAIHVLAPKSDYVSPCGACRQVLMEHLPARRVFLYQNEKESMSVTTAQLLPYHFKGESLKKSP